MLSLTLPCGTAKWRGPVDRGALSHVSQACHARPEAWGVQRHLTPVDVTGEACSSLPKARPSIAGHTTSRLRSSTYLSAPTQSFAIRSRAIGLCCTTAQAVDTASCRHREPPPTNRSGLQIHRRPVHTSLRNHRLIVTTDRIQPHLPTCLPRRRRPSSRTGQHTINKQTQLASSGVDTPARQQRHDMQLDFIRSPSRPLLSARR